MIFKNNTTRLVLFGSFTLVVIILASYFFVSKNAKQESYTGLFNNTLTLVNAENYEDAVIMGERTITVAETTEEKRAIEFLYAKTLLGRNSNNDFSNAISLLKEIAGDEKTEPQRRVGSIVTLANLYFDEEKRESLASLVFNSEPFSIHMDRANKNLVFALVSLLEQANSIFPSSHAHESIARLLWEEIPRTDKADKAKIDSLSRKMIDSISQMDELSSGDSLITEQIIARRQVLKSFVYGSAHYSFPDEITNEQVNDQYNRTLETLKNSTGAEIVFTRTALMYAASLNARQPGVMSDRIKEILDNIVDLGNENEPVKIAVTKDINESPFIRSNISALYTINANFAQFVNSAQNSSTGVNYQLDAQ